jgi:transcriptional regulator GlxA family with amidase domain
MMKRNLAILIFDDVEVLDFCGPFEVFSVTNELNDDIHLNVFTIAEQASPVLTRNGLSVNPRYTLADSPDIQMLLLPGGQGTRKVMNSASVLSWLTAEYEKLELLLSVCTGSLILAKAGLLDGLAATTHHEVVDLLRITAPKAEIDTSKRFIDNGKIIVAAGISAGIDMSLYVVSRLFGEPIARKTAAYMEYDWRL